MATNPRKRQQKLERRAAKRKEKKHEIVRDHQLGLGERLTVATKYPPLHAWITEDVWKEGLGWVLFSREMPNGSVAVVVFLVDRYCLGVKNAMANIVHRTTYESEFVRKMTAQFTSRAVSPATARKLVEAAIAYAADLGFPPHPDYHKAKLLFGDVDAGESKDEFEFGKDGKPFYVSGPNDSEARSHQIVTTLARTRGVGEFHYLVALDPTKMPPAAPGEDEDERSRLRGAPPGLSSDRGPAVS